MEFNLSAAAIKVAILLLPGFISYSIYRKLVGRGDRRTWEELFIILTFSLVSYLALVAIVKLLGISPKVSVSEMFTNEKSVIELWIVLGACGVGLIAPYLAAYIYNWKLVNKIGIRIRASKRDGFEEVWLCLHDRDDWEWAIVRDHREKLVYYGKVERYSSSPGLRELIMKDVEVYNEEDGRHLGDMEEFYLARQPDEISIEIVRRGSGEQK